MQDFKNKLFKKKAAIQNIYTLICYAEFDNKAINNLFSSPCCCNDKNDYYETKSSKKWSLSFFYMLCNIIHHVD